MTDLIERAKAMPLELLALMDYLPVERQESMVEAAAIIRELIAKVESDAEFVEIERMTLGRVS